MGPEGPGNQPKWEALRAGGTRLAPAGPEAGQPRRKRVQRERGSKIICRNKITRR